MAVHAAGYEPYERRGLPIGHGQDLDLGVVELEPAGSITVRVTGGRDAAPVVARGSC